MGFTGQARPPNKRRVNIRYENWTPDKNILGSSLRCEEMDPRQKSKLAKPEDLRCATKMGPGSSPGSPLRYEEMDPRQKSKLAKPEDLPPAD